MLRRVRRSHSQRDAPVLAIGDERGGRAHDDSSAEVKKASSILLREQVVEQQARRQQARGSEAARWQRRRDVDMSAAQGARHDEALYALGLHEACPHCGKGGAARRGWWAVLRPPFRVSRVVSCVA